MSTLEAGSSEKMTDQQPELSEAGEPSQTSEEASQASKSGYSLPTKSRITFKQSQLKSEDKSDKSETPSGAKSEPAPQPRASEKKTVNEEMRASASASDGPRVTRFFQSMRLRRSRQSIVLRPTLRFQPNYHLESSNPFDQLVVKDLLKTYVESQMENRPKLTFTKDETVAMIRNFGIEILQLLKAKEYDRYKLIIDITVGEKKHQSFRKVAGFLWDSETDQMASYVYDRHDLFLVVTVYGVYFDWNKFKFSHQNFKVYDFYGKSQATFRIF